MHPAATSSLATRRASTCIYWLSRSKGLATCHVATTASRVLYRHARLPKEGCNVTRHDFGAKRHFSGNHKPASNQEVALKHPEPEPEPISVNSPLSENEPTGRPQTSQIRESLRAWSTQNQRSKEEQALDTLPFKGKIKNIPNALFISADLENEELEERQSLLDELDDVDRLLGGNGRRLRPGSLMSHTDELITRQNVVYIGNNGIQSLFMLSDGRWAATRTRQMRESVSVLRHYVIPDFLSPEEVEMVREHMPKQVVKRGLDGQSSPSAINVLGPLPDTIIKSVLTKLRDFNTAEQQFARDHQHQLEQMYSNLASENEWRTINVLDLPALVLGMDWDTMTDVERKSFIHSASKAHPLFIGAQTANTLTFIIGPKSMDENVKQVQEWARLYQETAARASLGRNVSDLLRDNPLSAFIEKARRIILKSRKIRTPTKDGFLAPVPKEISQGHCQQVPTGEKFTKDDKKIIQYLWDIGLRRPVSRYPIAHASLIVRAIGAYPSLELGPRTIRMLLQELGCIDPWTSLEDLSVPLPRNRTSAEIDRLYVTALRSIDSVVDEETKTAWLPDSMAAIRKDWGRLDVLCIDASHTRIVEDGLSIEPASEVEDGYWIRVHVSHPTAHLTPDHPVSEYARKRGTTYYAFDENEPTFAMLPAWVLRQFTLDGGGPCLTVSTLITKDGHVHDIKVEAGTIHKVHRIDSDTVIRAMGEVPDVAQESILAVGRSSKIPGYNPDSDDKTDALSEAGTKFEAHAQKVAEFLPQLNLMKELLSARRARRREEVETPSQIPRLIALGPKWTTNIPGHDRTRREFNSYHWTGDPGIVVRASRLVDLIATTESHRSKDVNAQAMRLAAESMGKWLADRNVPAVFLGNDEPAAFSIQELNELSRHEETEKPLHLRLSHPIPFYDHNMKQYAACSSPLRKYIDMLTHFQIDAYLKAQAQGLIRPNARVEDESILALSRAQVDHYLAVDVYASDAMDDHARVAREHWTAQALFRAFHFKEAVLPEHMEVFIRTPTHRDGRNKVRPTSGTLLPWGLPAQLDPDPSGYHTMAKMYQFLPVRLVRIDPNFCLAVVCATGPPTTEQKLLEPIRAVTPENVLPPKSAAASESVDLA